MLFSTVLDIISGGKTYKLRGGGLLLPKLRGKKQLKLKKSRRQTKSNNN